MIKLILYPIVSLPDVYRAAWQDIQRTSPELQHPSLTPEYCEYIDKHTSNVQVISAQSDGEIVGILPISRLSNTVATEVGAPHTDLSGILRKPGTVFPIKQALSHFGIKSFRFEHVLAEQIEFKNSHAYKDESSIVDLEFGFDPYVAGLKQSKPRFHGQCFRKMRKMAREVGELRFELQTDDAALRERLVLWKTDQLKRKNYTDMFSHKWVENAVKHMPDLQTPNCKGRLSVLYAGNNPVALHLGILGFNCLTSWIPAHNPKFAKYSPGLILHLELFRAAASAGIRKVDLGRGENQLKQAFRNCSVKVGIGGIELSLHRRIRSRIKYSLRHALVGENSPMLLREFTRRVKKISSD
ncbi:MAG: GNAT family N-acetyltransferase [Pseudomonadota bacterium]